MLDQHTPAMKAGQIPLLAKLAQLPETIRGYGHIKEENIGKAMAEKARLEAELENNRFAAAAEESMIRKSGHRFSEKIMLNQ